MGKTICGMPVFCEIEMGPDFMQAICPACAELSAISKDAELLKRA